MNNIPHTTIKFNLCNKTIIFCNMTLDYTILRNEYNINNNNYKHIHIIVNVLHFF